MDKGEAKAKLREIIAKETKDVAAVPVNVTAMVLREPLPAAEAAAVEGHVPAEDKAFH